KSSPARPTSARRRRSARACGPPSCCWRRSSARACSAGPAGGPSPWSTWRCCSVPWPRSFCCGRTRPPHARGRRSPWTSWEACGSLAGSVAGGFLVGRLGPRRMVLTGAALFGAGATLLLVAELPLVLAGLVIAGAGIPAAVIGLATAAQAATPAHLMGRTQAVVNLALTVPQALSLGVGSALVAVLN